ncbi:hypothetical protein C8F01DRAFT_1257193 [Mycena amicta]|nr:hypothetical protein C8F01DRAFT_1257193 [Mycena amicta]
MSQAGKRKRVKILRDTNTPGLCDIQSVTLGPVAQMAHSGRTREAHRARLLALPRRQREKLETLQLGGDDGDEDEAYVDVNEVLDGAEHVELSHAGGELLAALEHEIAEEMYARPRRFDYRTRQDRTQRLADGFAAQMGTMLRSYMEWCALDEDGRQGVRWGDVDEGCLATFTVVDISSSKKVSVLLDASNGICASLLARGFVPCSPISPSVVISLEALEHYRVAHARCPRFVIQAFVKTLCDIHKVPYRQYLRAQFSIAYDLYLDLRRQAEKRVLTLLGRDGLSWRMKNDCPACGYKLEGEEKLLYDRLVTIDGNNSLKRVNGNLLGSQRVDNRDGGETYFLSREKVDAWARDRLAEVVPEAVTQSPCEDRWANMSEAITSKMWAVFDQTGIFMCLCRHGFALLIVEMIRSGELSKYPLAVVEALLDHFGPNTALGYDVGCKIETTIAQSELGEKARRLGLRCLVGSFHGHAHNRRCQLGHLATYLKGMGLEDFEGCERCFSRSNGLSNSCRYATPFHWKQEIASYFKQADSADTYANLSAFLCNNYKQALNLLEGETDLKDAMALNGIASTGEFEAALVQEGDFLRRLQAGAKSKGETGAMEYLRKLQALLDNQGKLQELNRQKTASHAPDAPYSPASSKINIKIWHARERVNRDLELVHELECELEIESRWTPSSPEWAAAEEEVRMHAYRKAVDGLELLVVQRLLELTKMNQSGTGYKHRKHISKSLQTRSTAVKNAIERYNKAAEAVTPPRPHLSWDVVVEYAFLSDFDLLRDDTNSLANEKWATPTFRLLMDRYFKLERAREEIQRLNIEIRRVITWIRDEDQRLRRLEAELRGSGDVPLAVQVEIYRQRRSIFDGVHLQRFRELARKHGDAFTGTLQPGLSLDGQGDESGMELDDLVRQVDLEDGVTHQEGAEIEEQEDLEAASGLAYQISILGLDHRERGDLVNYIDE